MSRVLRRRAVLPMTILVGLMAMRENNSKRNVTGGFDVYHRATRAARFEDAKSRFWEDVPAEERWTNDKFVNPLLKKSYDGDGIKLKEDFVRCLARAEEKGFSDPEDLAISLLASEKDMDYVALRDIIRKTPETLEVLNTRCANAGPRGFDLEENAQKWIVVSPSGVVLRETPNPKGRLIRVAKPGTELTEQEDSGVEGWVRVQEGFVPFKSKGEGGMPQTIIPVNETTMVWVVTSPGGINIREAPDMSARTVGNGLDQGALAIELEKHEYWVRTSSGWFATRHQPKGKLRPIVLAEPARAASLRVWSVVYPLGINVRARPTVSSSVLSELVFGEEVIELSRDGEWIRSPLGWCLSENEKGVMLSVSKTSNPINPGRGLSIPILSRAVSGGLARTAVEFESVGGDLESYILMRSINKSWSIDHYQNARFRSRVRELTYLAAEGVVEDGVGFSGVIPPHKVRLVLSSLLSLSRFACVKFSLEDSNKWYLTEIPQEDDNGDQYFDSNNREAVDARRKIDEQAEVMDEASKIIMERGQGLPKDHDKRADIIREAREGNTDARRTLGPKWTNLESVRDQLQDHEDEAGGLSDQEEEDLKATEQDRYGGIV
ncbi:hypothetical protein AAMO2058_000966400 [Amorphochlora amoebiformis]